MEVCEHTRTHLYFAQVYPKQLAALVEGMVESSNLPQGVLHGDPFLDNVLVDPETGEFGGRDDRSSPLQRGVRCRGDVLPGGIGCLRSQGSLQRRKQKQTCQ